MCTITLAQETVLTGMCVCVCVCSLVPRPHPALRRFQYGKAGDGKLGGAWEQGYVCVCEQFVMPVNYLKLTKI